MLILKNNPKIKFTKIKNTEVKKINKIYQLISYLTNEKFMIKRNLKEYKQDKIKNKIKKKKNIFKCKKKYKNISLIKPHQKKNKPTRPKKHRLNNIKLKNST